MSISVKPSVFQVNSHHFRYIVTISDSVSAGFSSTWSKILNCPDCLCWTTMVYRGSSISFSFLVWIWGDSKSKEILVKVLQFLCISDGFHTWNLSHPCIWMSHIIFIWVKMYNNSPGHGSWKYEILKIYSPFFNLTQNLFCSIWRKLI